MLPTRIRCPLSRLGAVTLLLALAGLPVRAHHSSAIYDTERTITLEGTVTDYEWANPHVYLYVDVSSDSDQPSIWEIEASPATLMTRRGWTRSTFQAGDRVSISANPGRNADERMALGRSVTTADGRTLAISQDAPSIAQPPTAGRGADPRTAAGRGVTAESLAGTWSTTIDPAAMATVSQFLFGPEMWPLTEAGSEALVTYRTALNPAADCLAYTAPFSMVFPDTKIIELGDDIATIRSSLDDDVRTVHFDVAADDGTAPSNQGFSAGHWEGGVLIVETTHFEPRLNGNAMRLPSGSGKHLTERFELSEDGTALIYRFELDDPEFLTAPVTGESTWVNSPGLEYDGLGCDLENARKYLRGLTPD